MHPLAHCQRTQQLLLTGRSRSTFFPTGCLFVARAQKQPDDPHTQQHGRWARTPCLGGAPPFVPSYNSAPTLPPKNIGSPRIGGPYTCPSSGPLITWAPSLLPAPGCRPLPSLLSLPPTYLGSTPCMTALQLPINQTPRDPVPAYTYFWGTTLQLLTHPSTELL